MARVAVSKELSSFIASCIAGFSAEADISRARLLRG